MDDPHLDDRIGELLELARIEVAARLVGADKDGVERDCDQFFSVKFFP